MQVTTIDKGIVHYMGLQSAVSFENGIWWNVRIAPRATSRKLQNVKANTNLNQSLSGLARFAILASITMQVGRDSVKSGKYYYQFEGTYYLCPHGRNEVTADFSATLVMIYQTTGVPGCGNIHSHRRENLIFRQPFWAWWWGLQVSSWTRTETVHPLSVTLLTELNRLVVTEAREKRLNCSLRFLYMNWIKKNLSVYQPA
jgi:hypothetical protein